MVAKLCGKGGCPHVQPCLLHRSGKQRAYDRRRGTSAARGYGSAWVRIRDAYLREHPTCECDRSCCPSGCGRRATDVDHVTPRPRGAPIDTERWDNEANLQALAGVPCHRRKTMRETNARRNRKAS